MNNNKIQNKANASINFLQEDFSQSYQQMRHYDNLIFNIVNFSFVQLLFGIGAIWTVYGFDKSKDVSGFLNENYKYIIIGILVICYIFSSFASFQIYKNRIYFVRTAKYINYHRHFFLSKKFIGFENKTKFYEDYNEPKNFDIYSTHLIFLLLMLIISFIISILLALLLDSIYKFAFSCVIFFTPILFVLYLSYIFYKGLSNRDK